MCCGGTVARIADTATGRTLRVLRGHLQTVYGVAFSPDGALIATPVNHQDSSLLANLSFAQALVIRPPLAPMAAKGTSCAVLRLPL